MLSRAVLSGKPGCKKGYYFSNSLAPLRGARSAYSVVPGPAVDRNKNFYYNPYCTFGEVVEWFKALVLKTSEVQASVGSNPTLSAI